jgi:hypothetical protein
MLTALNKEIANLTSSTIKILSAEGAQKAN